MRMIIIYSTGRIFPPSGVSFCLCSNYTVLRYYIKSLYKSLQITRGDFSLQ
ncbi:hypothetical protein RaK2_00323 [Klebsiella phage vB_KleM_RaK2]|uniref:Uncharacterized protein n=1 Tax=Klebsiella phage vB_KleM_RaK2 TaxID=1147094 RepID=H6X4D0_9CAUD|nr:hypothetical protein F403_gp212 [Klebsiella phage vB_KleM_RaK2]AFA44596.1 hypothetical protein RaK2_00323 [Klebsiella phage vB_KleM_RaK2]